MSEPKFELQAIKAGIFTEYELSSIIEYLQTDLEDMFWAINNMKGAELKRNLQSRKREYTKRYYNNELYVQNAINHSYNLLMTFIEDEIEKILISKIESSNMTTNENLTENLTENLSENKTVTHKLKWKGSLKDLVSLFHILKNHPTKEKKNENQYFNHIECNNEELIEFIFNNFELERMTKASVRKYLLNPNQLNKKFFY